MNAIVPFLFDDHAVRVTDQDGQPWFVLADVCALLGIRNPTQAGARLDETERAKLNIGRQGDATIVSLAGLLTLMLRCRDAMKPGSVPYRVRKWITADVVPTIMRTGSFGAPAANLDDNATLRSLLLGRMDQLDTLKAENDELSGKAAALDQIADSAGLLCMSDAGKAIGMAPKRFIAWLIAQGWIFGRSTGGHTASQARLKDGTLALKTIRFPRSNGVMQLDKQVMVTAKGLAKLAEQIGARP